MLDTSYCALRLDVVLSVSRWDSYVVNWDDLLWQIEDYSCPHCIKSHREFNSHQMSNNMSVRVVSPDWRNRGQRRKNTERATVQLNHNSLEISIFHIFTPDADCQTLPSVAQPSRGVKLKHSKNELNTQQRHSKTQRNAPHNTSND